MNESEQLKNIGEAIAKGLSDGLNMIDKDAAKIILELTETCVKNLKIEEIFIDDIPFIKTKGE